MVSNTAPNAGPSEYHVAASDPHETGTGAGLHLSRGTQPELGADLDSLRLDVTEECWSLTCRTL